MPEGVRDLYGVLCFALYYFVSLDQLAIREDLLSLLASLNL